MCDDCINRKELLEYLSSKRFSTEYLEYGKWRFVGSDRWNDAYECSKCGKFAMDDSNYCPNCGAKMCYE